jgi:oxygen-dependent protoporphyrinogen oxidase
MTAPRVIVVGAGVTGLSVAVTLQEEARLRGERLDLVVLERERQAGGHARTFGDGGFVVEAGPNGFLSREPETLALIDHLQLRPRLVDANRASARRFILREGRLCEVPTSPGGLVKSAALSWKGKARLLGEPFAAGPPGTDETVYDFAARRIGAEAAEFLVDTAVSGISAGDSRRLSVRAQFPMMVEMEREHGSLIRAMFSRRRSPGGPSRLVSFDAGMGVLTSAMSSRLGDSLATGVTISAVQRGPGGWLVRLDDGRSVEGDHVVFATPARATAGLVRAFDPVFAESLSEVPYAGLAVVGLGYRVEDVPHPLDGYGYLVTKRENLATLGVVWESSLFPKRAPQGHVLLRAMLGGARTPAVVDGSETECLALARRELGKVLGITAEPARSWVFRWPQAIAQYTVGHDLRLQRARQLAAAHPGLHLCGTSYDGVSFNHAVKAGRATARSLAAALWTGDGTPAARHPEAVMA